MIESFAEAVLSLPSFARESGLSMAIKSTIIVLAGLAAVRLTWRARASARHLVLVATFVGLLTLPLAWC
jgi:hypothetical protein